MLEPLLDTLVHRLKSGYLQYWGVSIASSSAIAGLSSPMNTSLGPYPQDVFWMRERLIGNREEFTAYSLTTVLVGPRPNLLRCTPVPWTADTVICGWPDWAVAVWLHTGELASPWSDAGLSLEQVACIYLHAMLQRIEWFTTASAFFS